MSIMTFTGIDAKTDSDWIKRMGRKYSTGFGGQMVEFAILRSPKAGQSARYPSKEDVRKITNYVYPDQLAFHLCGDYARKVHNGEWMELLDIIDFSLVSRVQVNSIEADDAAIVRLQRFAKFIGKPVIMQWRTPTFPYIAGDVRLLQDKSGGTGTSPSEWFTPDSIAKKAKKIIGYAGGLNPDNIKENLPKISKAAHGLPYWIDCESGVRTDDWFDKDKAESMMAAVFEFHGLHPNVA
jgi:phosphoribosylanthranilate isomerase